MATTAPLDYRSVQDYAHKLFKSPEGTTRAKYFTRSEAMAITLVMETGLRSNDLLRLKWDDIQDEEDDLGSYIEVKTKKTGASAWQALSVRATNMVAEYQATCYRIAKQNSEGLNEHIFYNYYGNASKRNPVQLFTSVWLRKRVKLANEAGKFGAKAKHNHGTTLRNGQSVGIGAHSLRKSYAQYLWQETKNENFVRQSLTHNSLSTTRQYLDMATENFKDLQRQLKQ